MKNVSTIDGAYMESCDVNLFRYKEMSIVIVNGEGINFCGHILLNFGGHGGFYVHVAQRNEAPRVMSESQYQTYLASYGKKELSRQKVNVGFPEKSLLFMEKLLAKKWHFDLLMHNCSDFVREVLSAGNYEILFPLHCPKTKILIPVD